MARLSKIIPLITLCCIFCINSSLAEPDTPAETQKTQVIIIGTIHQTHNKNPKYSPEILKEIILSLKPDAILNELPLSLIDPDGSPIKRLRNKNKSPESWASYTIATQLGIKQIPFDRPDRQKNFKKTRYFERQKQTKKLEKKWFEQLKAQHPNSVDIKTASLMGLAGQAEWHLFTKASPEIINSDAHDAVIRIKHSVWYDIVPTIFENYPFPQSQQLIDDYKFFKDQWHQRNKIMADNIIKAAKKYPGERLVVLTGATHRYILKDLLKDAKSIELKEYWEIIDPAKITKPKNKENTYPDK